MEDKEFDALLAKVGELDTERKRRLRDLQGTEDEKAAVIEAPEFRLGPKPPCPHCGTKGLRHPSQAGQPLPWRAGP